MSNISEGFNGSDSGLFLLDPEERALLRACADQAQRREEEDEAHRRFLKLARELPAVRLEKVLRIRRMIADGTYVTSERLNQAAARLTEALAQ
ncbi:MAG: flagellar biosynthesis anti-sigma factor FlgM [Planctomycetota bacterium]